MKITIFNISDPEGNSVGGSKTFLKGFIKYAPKDFEIKYVGVSSNKQKRPPRKWKKLNIEGVEVDFYPLFFVKNLHKKTIIPISIMFSLALKFFYHNVGKSVLFFNRIEPVIAFRKRNNPKIVIIHNDVTHQIKGKKSEVLWSKIPWLYFFFERKAFKPINKIYTVSHDSLNFYIDQYPEKVEKFSFISTWFDPQIFSLSNLSKIKTKKIIVNNGAKFPINAKWIIFVGRLLEQKAPQRLIDTFKHYYAKNKNSCLIIIGEGNLEYKTKKYVKQLGLEYNVHFTGFKDQLTLVDYYRAADVMLLVSNYEGMPICVLEALGCGLPVVSTNVGEVNRMVKNGYSGEVTKSFDIEDITGNLDKVLSQPMIYKPENCIKSSQVYTPEKVLKSLYTDIRKLNDKKSLNK